MSGATFATNASVQPSILQDGYAFVQGGAMREILAPFGSLSDWLRFADSWNHLELDTYMADGGRYRRRRYAAYTATPAGAVHRRPHQPHYQALDYNPLNGGIARWFEPIAPDVGQGPTMQTILACCRALFTRSVSEKCEHAPRTASSNMPPHTRAWRIEVHQFRIEARPGEDGRPTPEGLHRDGVDYVLVLLVDRRNIASGTTTIHAMDGRRLGHFTLTDPLDAALLEDARVAHGVTPVQALDPTLPAYRDVLVVTFTSDPTGVASSSQ